MRVVHLSTYDLFGGAAKSAYRLHRGLLAIGCDSTMLVSHRSGSDLTVRAFVPPMDPVSRVRRRLRRRRIATEMARYGSTRPATANYFTDDRSQYGVTALRQLPETDVVNLHWVAEFLDFSTCFPSLAGGSPVVWTLHDENAFTGGCHFVAGCQRYDQGCGECPQLGSKDEHDLSARIWGRKKRAYAAFRPRQLRIVTPSAWLADRVRASALLGGLPVEVIPYGIDTGVFTPHDKAAARRKVGLPADARVVICAALSLGERRKGVSVLTSAMAPLFTNPKLHLVTLGDSPPPIPAGVRHHHLGFIADERALAIAYSAADATVVASLEDNLPNTILESFACGTPVVAFASGGIPEAVRPNATGMLVSKADSDGLRQALADFLANPGLAAEMSAISRRVALREYALPVQAARYFQLYEEVLSS